MKHTFILIKISLILCTIAFVMTIGDYLALHDIGHDYVSKEVIESYKGGSVLNLPEWSETKPEWLMVNISGLVRIAYFIFSAATLAVCLKTLRKLDQNVLRAVVTASRRTDSRYSLAALTSCCVIRPLRSETAGNGNLALTGALPFIGPTPGIKPAVNASAHPPLPV